MTSEALALAQIVLANALRLNVSKAVLQSLIERVQHPPHVKALPGLRQCGAVEKEHPARVLVLPVAGSVPNWLFGAGGFQFRESAISMPGDKVPHAV
jgi:hypothetical protein